MLSVEDNELLTRAGPGTTMGELFRRFWMPVLLSRELPEPDCPPVRATVLGEERVAFRDTSGRVGLVEARCSHRGADLFFGRNEECGLRCVYHGWKFDADGRCLDMPPEPEESTFKDRIRLGAYPCAERGGVIWAYLGPAERQPALPELEWALLPEDQRFASKRLQECNWLQAMEGGIDSSHISFLHRGDLSNNPLFKGAAGNKYNLGALSPVFEVVDTPGGLLIGARRNAEDDQYYWRITPFVMPCYTGVPPRGDHPIHGHFWVPIDDESCWA